MSKGFRVGERWCVCGCPECAHLPGFEDDMRPCEGLVTFIVKCPCKDFKEAVPSHRLYGTDPRD